MLMFFYAPGACSLASHIVLEEIGVAYDSVRLDLMAGDQHRPEFRSVNPLGKVPALVTDRGTVTETPAILSFLADLSPGHGLLPADPFSRAQCASTMSWLASSVHIGFARYWRQALFTPEENAWQGLKAKAQADITEAMARMDAALDGLEWYHGTYSVVDPYVLVMRRWGSRIGLDMTAYPNLVAHGLRVAARPAAARAIAREGIRIDG
jgi:glutathione S-transferase